MRNGLLSDKELEYIINKADKIPFKRGVNPTLTRISILDKIHNLPEIVINLVNDLTLLQSYAEYKGINYTFCDKKGKKINYAAKEPELRAVLFAVILESIAIDSKNGILSQEEVRSLLFSFSMASMLKINEIIKNNKQHTTNQLNDHEVFYNIVKSQIQRLDITKITPQILSKIYNMNPKKVSRYLNNLVKLGYFKKVKKGVYELIPP